LDSQLSVYTGSCDALQCLVGNDDFGACSPDFYLSSTALFFGEQDVMYHVRVHGYDQQKGDFALTVEEVNIALPVCEKLKLDADNPYSGTLCGCTEDGQDAVLSCSDECSYCNADKSVCATKTTVSSITASFRTGVSAKSATYTYTQGVEGVLLIETTECYSDGNCSACSVAFNGEQCNSCTPSQCSGGDSSFDIDCTNIDPNTAFSFCDSPVIESGPLQVLSADGFGKCLRDPLEACNSVMAFQNVTALLNCECTGSDSGATLTCSDPACLMSCNLDYTVCWVDSSGTVFGADGQPSSTVDVNTYKDGRDEIVTWEGRGSDLCSLTVNGEPCNSCGTITCSDGSQAPSVDCENVESGASFDFCDSYAVEGQTGVLQAFNDYETWSCLSLADPQAICQQEVEYNAQWGSYCECALDPVSGEEYTFTCEEDCLYCNSEYTVCAKRVSGRTINKYGHFSFGVNSFTYVSGGRDETVILENFGSGKDCSITVNDTPCNSCGPSTCTDESGYEFVGNAVDCENIEPGASFDNCDGQGFVVETGVLEVATSFEFAVCSNGTGPDMSSEEIEPSY
jgi:hypothetical protein